MGLSVREFAPVLVDRGPADPALAVAGEIRNDTYVLTVGPAEVPLPTASAGEDGLGLYAVLIEGRTDVSGGLTLEVLEEDHLQAEVSLYRVSPWATGLATPPSEQTEGILILPKETLVSVHFHPDGALEYATAPQRVRPQQQPIRH